MSEPNPNPIEPFAGHIKLALFAFVVAKLSGIAAMMSMYAGLRPIAKTFLITAGVSLGLSIIISLWKPKEDKATELEIQVVRNLIKSGKLDYIIKEIKAHEQT